MLENVINYCSILLGENDTDKLTVLFNVAVEEFKDYCHREDTPESATSLIANMVCILYNRIGAQGLASQSYSGVSETFIDGYPDNIKKQLNRYRKLTTI